MKTYFFISILIAAFLLSSWKSADGPAKNKRNETVGTKKTAKRKAAIDFSFCLLNKNGEKSTQFLSGENFIFSLLLGNNSGDTLYLDNSFLTDGSGFCAVYNHNGELVGQPFASNGSQVVSSDNHPFFGNHKEYKLEIPWSDPRPFWTTLHHNFKSLKQEALPPGKYYTVFKHRFCFDRNSDKPSLCLQPVELRIDFEVK